MYICLDILSLSYLNNESMVTSSRAKNKRREPDYDLFL